MGVCSAVREAALAIDAKFGGADPSLRSAAQALASMPDWLEQGRLDLWEEQVQGAFALDGTSSVPMSLLDEAFEFGRFNLYSAFQAEKTVQEFHKLAARLAQHGVMLDASQPVSDWWARPT